MVIGKAAEKKATRTSVKGSISSVDNLLKRSMLYFSSSDKKVVFKDSNFFVSLLQHCSREREREREKERERKREREKKRKRETERDTERQRGRERQRETERAIEWKHIFLFPPISHNQYILYS